MIKRCKIIECNYCHSKEIKAIRDYFIYPESSLVKLPAGWVEVNHKIHFCPKCAHAIDILRAQTSAWTKNNEKI